MILSAENANLIDHLLLLIAEYQDLKAEMKRLETWDRVFASSRLDVLWMEILEATTEYLGDLNDYINPEGESLDRLVEYLSLVHPDGLWSRRKRLEHKPAERKEVRMTRATVTTEIPGGSYAAPPSRGRAVTAEGAEIEVVNDGSLPGPIPAGRVIKVVLVGGNYYPIGIACD